MKHGRNRPPTRPPIHRVVGSTGARSEPELDLGARHCKAGGVHDVRWDSVPLPTAVAGLHSVDGEPELAPGDHANIVGVMVVVCDVGVRGVGGEQDVASFGSQPVGIERPFKGGSILISSGKPCAARTSLAYGPVGSRCVESRAGRRGRCRSSSTPSSHEVTRSAPQDAWQPPHCFTVLARCGPPSLGCDRRPGQTGP